MKLLNTFRIPGTNYGGAECADPSGYIFVPSTAYSGYGSMIYEYAHGGTTPIARLSDLGQAYGCAVDPRSGNLAAANQADFTNPNGTSQGDLALYVAAHGDPTMLSAPQSVNGFESCAYDKQSNLYLAGSDSSHLDRADLLRLPSGGSSFESITVNKRFGLYASLQWQGKRLMVSSWPGQATPVAVYRLSINGEPLQSKRLIRIGKEVDRLEGDEGATLTPEQPVEYQLDELADDIDYLAGFLQAAIAADLGITERGWRKIIRRDVTPLVETAERIRTVADSRRGR